MIYFSPSAVNLISSQRWSERPASAAAGWPVPGWLPAESSPLFPARRGTWRRTCPCSSFPQGICPVRGVSWLGMV